MPVMDVQWVVRLAVLAAAAKAPKAPRIVDTIQAFGADQRIVATYYYNWYVDGRACKYHGAAPHGGAVASGDAANWPWEPYYPPRDEPGAAIFGLNDPAAWYNNRLPNTSKWPDSDDWLYHVAELRAMKWAGVDLVFVDTWWPHDFAKEDGVESGPEPTARPAGRKGRSSGAPARPARTSARKIKKGSPCPELAALFRAWKYLDQRGEQPVKLAPLIETPSFSKADVRGAPDGKPDLLFEPIWTFYRQFLGDDDHPPNMPRRAIAAITDKRKNTRLVVHLFYPRTQGQPESEWISRWNAATFRDLRSRFRGMTGYPLHICVNQHLHGPTYGGWDGVQADGSIVEISRRAGIVDQEVTWHASLNGPRMREDSIAIGYGYFRAEADKRPGGDARNADGSPAYPRAYRYFREDDRISSPERQWQEVLSTPECFKKHLLVLESWNELVEGTQLSPAKPKTRQDEQGHYIDRWGESPTAYLELTRKYVAMWKGSGDGAAERSGDEKSRATASRPAAGPTDDKAASKPAKPKRRAKRR